MNSIKLRIVLPLLTCIALIIQGAAAYAEEASSDKAAAKDGEFLTMQDKLNYLYGYEIGTGLREDEFIELNFEKLLEGLRHALDGIPSAISLEEQGIVVDMLNEKRQAAQEKEQAAQQQAREKRQVAADENKMAGLEYLADNATREGVSVTDSGLQMLVIKPGTGPSPSVDDTVVVHYEGRLISGEVFDSSYKRHSPAEFGLRRVIPGWTEGLQLMKTGGTYRLFIPSELAYGPNGTGSIPGNSVLIFDVELLEIK